MVVTILITLAATAYLLGKLLKLRRFDDFVALNATGANLLAGVTALRQLHANGLQVGIKATARAVVSVRNVIAKLGAFATDIASFSHFEITSEIIRGA
jgi:hypothetical protein